LGFLFPETAPRSKCGLFFSIPQGAPSVSLRRLRVTLVFPFSLRPPIPDVSRHLREFPLSVRQFPLLPPFFFTSCIFFPPFFTLLNFIQGTGADVVVQSVCFSPLHYFSLVHGATPYGHHLPLPLLDLFFFRRGLEEPYPPRVSSQNPSTPPHSHFVLMDFMCGLSGSTTFFDPFLLYIPIIFLLSCELTCNFSVVTLFLPPILGG